MESFGQCWFMTMAKKPTGDIGPIGVSLTDGPEWQKVRFPATKEGIEEYIAQRFVDGANEIRSERFRFAHLNRNPQQDLDFTVGVAGRSIYLELLEVAPLNEGGYETAPPVHRPYDMAEWIFAQIRKKGTRQGPGLDRILLLYVTHWGFHLSGTTVALLQYWLLAEDFGYLEIHIYEPLDAEHGNISTLVPVPREYFTDFDPEKYRDNVVLNLDPAKFELAQTRSKQTGK